MSEENLNCHFNFESANDCDTAVIKIEQALIQDGFDLVFLDISLPPTKDGKMISGEELGVRLRQTFPEVKIIVSTSHNKNIRLNSIFKSLDPEGFLIKNDLTSEVLVEAINAIMTDPPYYSKTVLKFLRKTSTNDFVLDKVDRQLLCEISRGTKMKELPDILMLSIAAVERRKRILKEVFNVEAKGDRDLIQAAEDAGFI